MAVSIREATVADLPLIDELVNDILAEYELPKDSAVTALDSIYYCAGGLIYRGEARFWVAVAGNEVIGSAAVVPDSDSTCTFKSFYVKAKFRGQGIGYRLYTTAELFARARHYQKMHLYVSRRFQKAIEFYLRNGYRLVEEVNNLWEDNIYLKELAGLSHDDTGPCIH